MAWKVPQSLSPTSIGLLTQCSRRFKFERIDHLEEGDPTIEMVRGIVVHDALFRLFWHDRPRSEIEASACLTEAWLEAMEEEDFAHITDDEWQQLLVDATVLVTRLGDLEDPLAVTAVGMELRMEGTFDGEHKLVGIIDRLDLEADGTFTVTDYKTGKAPSKAHMMDRMHGVLVYAAMVEDTLHLPVGKVQLYHLGGKKPQKLVIRPTKTQLQATRRRVAAAWDAVEVGCESEHFMPNIGPLCGWCPFTELCPEGTAYLREHPRRS